MLRINKASWNGFQMTFQNCTWGSHEPGSAGVDGCLPSQSGHRSALEDSRESFEQYGAFACSEMFAPARVAERVAAEL
jgi:hypothetical protein